MFCKIAILACVLAVSQAGFLAGPSAVHYALPTPTLTSTSDNVLRSPGNLAQISTQSKTISTPYSSSSKSDVRVSNPAVYAHAAQFAYAAPIAHAAAPVSYAAPLAHAAAPVSYAAPLAHAAAPVAPAGSLLGVAYSPAVAVSHMTYSSPIGISYSY